MAQPISVGFETKETSKPTVLGVVLADGRRFELRLAFTVLDVAVDPETQKQPNPTFMVQGNLGIISKEVQK